MRILVDTNILISAILFPDSKPAKALLKVSEKHKMVFCEQNLSEFREVIERKAPEYLSDAEVLLSELSYELLPASYQSGMRIRDPKDQPILNAAILANVDLLITGDKDFLVLDLEQPRCITAAQFLERLLSRLASSLRFRSGAVSHDSPHPLMCVRVFVRACGYIGQAHDRR